MKKNNKKTIFLIFFIFIIYLIIKEFRQSILLKTRERVNLIFYSSAPIFFSFSKSGLNYYLEFNPKLKAYIPGGYGYYRIGALGKLVSLEKKPEIYKRTFSILTSSMINLYFYPCQAKIFYKKEEKNNLLFKPFLYCSNANFLDRFLTFYYLLINNKKLVYLEPQINKGEIFDHEKFFKKNQGIFYELSFRNENKSVQILYTKSYKSALMINQIVEGQGIVVNDIDQIDFYYIRNPNTNLKKLNFKNNCFVIENKKRPSLISKVLIDFFNCGFFSGETEISDIILVMAEKEKEWE